jgi:gentisate 1,2-dioxygenase
LPGLRNPNPMIHYRGADVREALHGLRTEKGDAYEAIQLEFVNPATGGPVGSTLQHAAQLLRPGEATLAKRETCNTFVVVMDGQGYTEVGGQRFEWEPNDIVVMPNFLWRRHVNTGKKDAVLYTVSDGALIRNIGQYRAQGKTAAGSIVQIMQ